MIDGENFVFEPGAFERDAGELIKLCGAASLSTAAKLSIAISLKRIADALDGVTDHNFDKPAIRTRED